MKLYWAISELMHLTRRELCELSDHILRSLPDFEPGSVERHDALASLDNIRHVIRLRHDPHPALKSE